MSPGPIFEPEGDGADWWGAARACFAAGFRTGDIVHNSFAYHLTPGGFILESGAHALGCAVIPGGVGNTEQQLEAIAHYKPSGYVGTPDFLKILLDTAEKSGKDASLVQARAGVGRGAAGLAARGTRGTRRRRAAMLCHRRTRRDRLRERGARRHDRQRERHRRDRAARHRRSGARRRGRRGGRHLVQSGLSDDPARHRRSVRDPAGRLAVRAHQCAHQGLDGPRRPDRQGQGHVRASEAGRRGRRAPSRSSRACGWWSAARPSRTP